MEDGIMQVQSIEKYGFCEEVIFKNCGNEKLLICLGNYSNINKVTKETIDKLKTVAGRVLNK